VTHALMFFVESVFRAFDLLGVPVVIITGAR